MRHLVYLGEDSEKILSSYPNSTRQGEAVVLYVESKSLAVAANQLCSLSSNCDVWGVVHGSSDEIHKRVRNGEITDIPNTHVMVNSRSCCQLWVSEVDAIVRLLSHGPEVGFIRNRAIWALADKEDGAMFNIPPTYKEEIEELVENYKHRWVDSDRITIKVESKLSAQTLLTAFKRQGLAYCVSVVVDNDELLIKDIAYYLADGIAADISRYMNDIELHFTYIELDEQHTRINGRRL